MKRSTDRILTTHTGSLPRPMDLAAMLEAFDSGAAPDRETFEPRVRAAVAEVVKIQVESGVDVVSDGEQGKVGYSTYVRHRLTGFDGEGSVSIRSDWADFPEAVARQPRPTTVSRPACDGPIEWKDREAVQSDIANFKAALSGVNPAEAFMTAASPGVIAHFLINQYFPSHEAYLGRLAEVMKEEYNAIHQAGILLQVDCPDLAMGRHLRFPDLSNQEFLKIAEANIEALNHALSDIPPDRIRLHLCWGNYEGPHQRDIPMEDIIGVVLKARPQALSFEGANPRHEHEWEVFRNVKLPDGKIIIPGVLDSTTNYIEHPQLVAQRIVRYAELVGRENVIAGSDCGFGTFARTNNMVEPEIVWAKFQAMAEGARLATERLWK
ncbi:MAG: cobalamin-independent methionine synthase II family protein [Chloroflexi bacterium]|nr:cobalamin-independent methionine synthase II family protein [Chloroflexota bacterium]MCI0786331.1 cobalamin-independent methionine synthase II family protein [Chloroflexota bacterium]MCI0793067.1 cobalamin-independent methionine synthase II family protein [Chloroflexota bacterium]MCI0798833.1 cobalamin-independent methionine synthase II family protein [Chloroflexota bacterium]MCI0824853.1 cobalamin-independent methionine synthase II family protein [Chloroflexota bacterium]